MDREEVIAVKRAAMGVLDQTHRINKAAMALLDTPDVSNRECFIEDAEAAIKRLQQSIKKVKGACQ